MRVVHLSLAFLTMGCSSIFQQTKIAPEVKNIYQTDRRFIKERNVDDKLCNDYGSVYLKENMGDSIVTMKIHTKGKQGINKIEFAYRKIIYKNEAEEHIYYPEGVLRSIIKSRVSGYKNTTSEIYNRRWYNAKGELDSEINFDTVFKISAEYLKHQSYAQGERYCLYYNSKYDKKLLSGFEWQCYNTALKFDYPYWVVFGLSSHGCTGITYIDGISGKIVLKDEECEPIP